MNNLVRGNTLQLWRKYFVKHCTTTAISAAPKQKEKHSYDAMITQRQVEATRSVVVQVSSEKSFAELYNYCSAFGTITKAHHYSVQHDENLHYILLEFAEVVEAAAAIDSSSYNEDLVGVPVRSPFLWFRAANGKQQLKSSSSSTSPPAPAATIHLSSIEGSKSLGNDELSGILRSARGIEEQIRLLHQHTQLNDIGVRLRFIAALQVQQAVSGMFPEANAQPFGSSVNGFGKMGCDLDLILRFDREVVGTDESGALKRHRKASRLVFHTKENLTNGRSQVQRQMESIGDMLQLFLPGVCYVRRILQARVPIIKYHHEHLNLEVDLSMSNLTGFYMSELLYMFGELDERVRPLTFAIRRWANACGLTNPSPGRWITNFSLTLLVIFFLQHIKQPILPSINVLMKGASSDDLRITEDGINCSFSRDVERVGFRTRNQTQVNELLLQFFEFYSQFDFHNRAISLNEGRPIAKPDHSALYIVNPLEQILNVSKNVSLEECERLRIEVRNAAWILESEVENQTIAAEERQHMPWGLENLLKTNEQATVRPNMFFRPRMVDVSDLFDKSDAAATSTAVKGNGKKAANVNYKNATVKQQVQNIKTQARNDLKQMRLNEGGSATASVAADGNGAAVATTKRRRSR